MASRLTSSSNLIATLTVVFGQRILRRLAGRLASACLEIRGDMTSTVGIYRRHISERTNRMVNFSGHSCELLTNA